MTSRPESWSRPADVPAAWLAVAGALAVLLTSWLVLHEGFYARSNIIDTPLYERYGEAIAAGEVPYRDFAVEYPPAALPVFALPALLDDGTVGSDFRTWFEALMLLCAAAMVVLMGVALGAARASPLRLGGALGFAALAPLALGSVVLSRFDLWPAALSVGALAALAAGRERLGAGSLAVAVAAKLYAGVLAPLALVFVWKTRGRHEALVCASLFVGVLAALFAPFLALAPGGVWDSFGHHGERPLQIESLGSALVLASHHVFDTGVTVESSYGSQNLAGGVPDVIAVFQTAAQAVAVVAVWVWFARGTAERERLFRASAAAVCALVALGKVLSPQFLLWLVPLVPLVRGRRGLLASAVLALALVVTQLWFPYRYWDLASELDAFASWLVLARDLALLGLLTVLVWPTRPRREVVAKTAGAAPASTGVSAASSS